MKYLQNINCPEDLKKLNLKELDFLAQEIREYLIDTLKTTGGHLASNLGAVELSLALHYVFDSPTDKIVFDVGHQSYVHKIITGRRDELKTIRQADGISGFPKRSESCHDAFDTGHASTSISSALGMVRARDIMGQKHAVISVIGDGSLTGGMAFEALNNIGKKRTQFLIVLNDNQMSISKNVGALSTNLTKFRTSKGYRGIKSGLKRFFSAIPLIGKPLTNMFRAIKRGLKRIFMRNLYFENYDLRYLGPIDGHDIKTLVKFLQNIKDSDKPTLLHIMTQKGRGLTEAEDNPEKYHGVNKDFTDSTDDNFSQTIGNQLCLMASQNPSITAITAAMPDGTGLNTFAKQFPDRFFDVGIAEEHAITLACGMAVGGLKPYACIYSSFMQRSYDQVLHDMCLQDLPVVLCLDRAGLVGSDGQTHQGIYDLSYLSTMPNLTIFAPKDIAELVNALEFSQSYQKPLAIRYPKNCVKQYQNHQPIEIGKWEQICKGKSNIVILAVGNRMLNLAEEIAEVIDATVVNARFVKPLDYEYLNNVDDNTLIVTLEDNILHGGFGSAVKSVKKNVLSFGMQTDYIVPHATVSQQLEMCGLTAEKVIVEINKYASR